MRPFIKILMIFFSIFFFKSFCLFSAEIPSDEKIVNSIVTIFIKDYDSFKDKTNEEIMILQLAKKPYFDNLKLWKKNFRDVSKIKLKLHPVVELIVKTVEKDLPKERGKYFRGLAEELNFLVFRYFQLYLDSVRSYLAAYGDKPVTLELIDNSIIEPQFFEKKMVLSSREKELSKEIRAIMTEKELKTKLSVYILALDYFNRVRDGIEKKDIERMKKKINEKKLKFQDSSGN